MIIEISTKDGKTRVHNYGVPKYCGENFIVEKMGDCYYYNVGEIEHVKLGNVRFVPWKDNTEKIHLVRENGCVLCEHGSDIFLDPLRSNGIYYVHCKKGMEYTGTCEFFEKQKGR